MPKENAMSREIIQEIIKGEVTLLFEEESKKSQVAAAVDMLSQLTKSGPFAGKAYIAGGWVRDSVLGRVSDDIDISVEMEDGGPKFAKWIAQKIGSHSPVIFENFGTAMIPLDGVTWGGVDLSGLKIEFVTTRTETYTPDGGRKPQVGFGTIQDDVERRDFTVNALLYDLTNNEIVDLVGGLEDIKKGIIRTPLEPDIIFNEDPLRMLRAVRFAGRYGWQIDPAIEDSIKNNVHLLSTISRERVRDELVKIIQGASPEGGLKFLLDTGLWDLVFPDIPMASVSESDVMHAIEVSGGLDSLFFALMGNLTGSNMKSVAKSLKLDNNQIKRIDSLMNAFAIMDGDGADDYKARKAGAFAEKAGALPELGRAFEFYKIAEPSNFGEQPTIFFSGNGLMSSFQLKPGPILAKLTELQKELWFANPAITAEEVLVELRNFLERQGV